MTCNKICRKFCNFVCKYYIWRFMCLYFPLCPTLVTVVFWPSSFSPTIKKQTVLHNWYCKAFSCSRWIFFLLLNIFWHLLHLEVLLTYLLLLIVLKIALDCSFCSSFTQEKKEKYFLIYWKRSLLESILVFCSLFRWLNKSYCSNKWAPAYLKECKTSKQ